MTKEEFLAELTTDELFENCYLVGAEIDEHWNDDCSSDEYWIWYFAKVDEWKFWHDEIKVRCLELAYMDYCANRNLMGV